MCRLYNRHATFLTSHLLNLLSSPNITSTDFISTQYDHEVQGSSVIKPIQGAGRVNNEASVIRPILTSKKAVVTSYGLVPSLSETNPYLMAQMSIDNAVRAAVAAGANIDYLAILDNFCWCSSNEPERLWQLKEALRAAYDTAVIYGTPFVSGKDSMFNDFKGFGADGKPVKISIPPTLLITTFGVIPDATKALSIDAKMAGDILYIVGSVPDFQGRSHKADESARYIDAQTNLSIYRAFYRAGQKDLIASAISVNQGGIAVALAKKLIAGNLGAEVKIKDDLFTEAPGRILIAVDPKKVKQLEKIFGTAVLQKIGTITKQPVLKINNLKISVSEMNSAYKKTFKDF